MFTFFSKKFISFLFITASFIITQPIYAQVFEGDYLPFGLGYTKHIVKDASISPVSYSGHAGFLGTGYYSQNERWLSQLNIYGFSGILKPDVNPQKNHNSALLISGRVNYNLSYKVKTWPNNWSLFAGILSYNIWDYREIRAYTNNSFNYNALFSLGTQLTAQRSFKIFKKDFGFEYGLGLPIGTYFLRPSYIKPLFAEKAGAKDFAFWGDYFQLNSQLNLYWRLNSSNLIRIAYQWEYSALYFPNKVQSANHILSLSTIYKF